MVWTRGSRPLLGAEEIAVRVEALARTIAPEIDDDWVVVCLLLGGLWFAADLHGPCPGSGATRPSTRFGWRRTAMRAPRRARSSCMPAFNVPFTVAPSCSSTR